ncbi:MAG: hypothetical protein ACTHJ8_09020, partial [Mucilaginibacter sp.]
PVNICTEIMQSKIFWFYIRSTSKPYSSSYYSLNNNYIDYILGCATSPLKKKTYLLNETDQNAIDAFLFEKYEIEPFDYAS